MAKMFYSLGETMERLKTDHNGVQAHVGAKRLQRFQDGSRPIYLVSEVDALAPPSAGPVSSAPMLPPEDS